MGLIGGVSLGRDDLGIKVAEVRNGIDEEGRGEGSVSTGDTIIASEGDSVCCIARAGTDADGRTGVCGGRLACLGDRDPVGSGGGDSSANFRFLPECGDAESGCGGCGGCGGECSGTSERRVGAGFDVMVCHWVVHGGGGGTWCPFVGGCLINSNTGVGGVGNGSGGCE